MITRGGNEMKEGMRGGNEREEGGYNFSGIVSHFVSQAGSHWWYTMQKCVAKPI